jgi:hypothetical protein
MARPLSTKGLTLRVLNDATSGPATKYAALQAARPHLSFEEYGKHLRQLAAVARAKVLRLCLLALAEHESGERTQAAENAKAEADAKRREEIDRILADAARELALPDAKPPTIQGVPNAKSSVIPDRALEPHPVPLRDPQHGVLSAPVPAIRELEEQRAAALKRGRELAATILAQLERNYRAPYNFEEGIKLDNLQAAFVAWERETRDHFPEIDTATEFPDSRLRPVPSRITNERSYRIKRRTLTFDEQRALSQERPTPTHEDSGFWGGAGPGI